MQSAAREREESCVGVAVTSWCWRVGVGPSSSSRVNIAPWRHTDRDSVGPADRKPTFHVATAVDADRYRLVGHYSRPRPAAAAKTDRRTTRHGGDRARRRRPTRAVERQKAIKGRLRVTERSSRRLPAPFCFPRLVPCPRRD